MLSRRRFLSASAIGAGMMFPAGQVLAASKKNRHTSRPLLAGRAFTPRPAPVPLDGSTLTKFVDALPIPGILQPASHNRFQVVMSEAKHKLHSNLPRTTVWSYSGPALGGVGDTYLGPTIAAQVGTPTSVTWVNNLPTRYLPTLDSVNYSVVDDSLIPVGQPGPGGAVVHLHGGKVPSAIDGDPWQTFPSGQSRTYVYPNIQDPTLLWYHDHSWGMTRLNVYAGLAGAYLLLDPNVEGNLNLPSGPFHIPLVIQDRVFDTNGQLYYPTNSFEGTIPSGETTSPWPGPSVPEFFGDTILVNGKVWPYLNVEPRRYRFRFLNGSQSRCYDLTLTGPRNVPSFIQIGAEGGYLPAPVSSDSLLLAPAERADVIIDFSGFAGQTFLLSNSANGPYPAGDAPDSATTAQVMQIRVALPLSSPDTTSIPTVLPFPGSVAPPAGAVPIEVVMFEQLDLNESVRLQLGPAGGPVLGRSFDESIVSPFLFPNRTIQLIRFVNTTGDTHPMHTHLFTFQIVGRQAFNVNSYVPKSGNTPLSVSPYLLGRPIPPDPNERGFKDTVRVNPGEIADVVALIDADPSEVAAGTANYVLHCHILEHEEKDMMTAFRVV
jgi:spore coat protein A, manganese oxidase